MDNFALLMNVLYHFAEHYEDRFILREILDNVDQYCDEDDHKKFDNNAMINMRTKNMIFSGGLFGVFQYGSTSTNTDLVPG